MNKILDNYLCKSYPHIFVERSKSVGESCMGRGFECGNGWFPIIDSLCHQIQEHIDWNNGIALDDDTNKLGLGKKKKRKKTDRQLIPQFVALQVKEKFGSLRIYYRGGDEYCRGLVSMAKAWSWCTCEICGKGGKRHVGHTAGWIGSICDECSVKIKRPIEFNTDIKKMLNKAIKEDLKLYV